MTKPSTRHKRQPPTGWISAGSHPQDYEVSSDNKVRHKGKRSGYIKSVVPRTHGFGTLMQMFDAEHYCGKRVRLSAYIKSEGISGWAGLWMRVDGEDDRPTAFDNME